MKRITSILILVLLVCGCGWFGRKDRVIQPDEEFPASAPATRPAVPAADNGSQASSRPTAPRSSTGPSGQYRVVGEPEVVAATMLQVNDKFITLDDVLGPLGRRLRQAAAGASRGAFRLKALGLIREEIRVQTEQTLLLAEAEDRLTDAEKRFVREESARRFRQAVAEVGGSRARFEQRLRAEGTDLAAWRRDLRRSLMIRTYIERRLGKRIVVNRRMMWDYYVGHRGEFRKSDRVRMQTISVPWGDFLPKSGQPTEEDRQEARRKARALIDKAAAALARGEDFAKVARAFSRGPMASSGGLWPLMERGSFRAEAVEETAFAQPAGKVSKVIETPKGFHIVKTLEVQRGEKITFEDAQEKIAEKLHLRLFEKLTQDYRARLYSGATIIATDRFERLAVEAAVRRFYQQ